MKKLVGATKKRLTTRESVKELQKRLSVLSEMQRRLGKTARRAKHA